MAARMVEARLEGRTLAHLRVADSFFARLVGLLHTRELAHDAGLLIRPCNAVHTLGMAYAIDVLFLSKEGRVLKVVHAMPPGRLGAPVRGAKQVVELPAGAALRHGVVEGGHLEFC